VTLFLLKGLLRDRNRSLFPLLIVAAGVAINVFAYCFLLGVSDEIVRTNAMLDTGHVKIMTRGYASISGQLPNDLALLNVGALVGRLRSLYPDLEWAARIKFGGLLDIPDEQGETRAQGPVFGLGLDLLGPASHERGRLNLEKGLMKGRLPQSPGEILVSEKLASHLGVRIGEMATLISSTANGAMAVQNFTVVGTLQFGIGAMDRGAMLVDIADIRYALDMADSAGEVLGYFPHMIYDEAAADRIALSFKETFRDGGDDFSPVMLTLKEQSGLGQILDMGKTYVVIVLFGLILVMSIVLWNTGLMSGLRRYGEMGVRLAMGESKGHVYRSLLHESVLIGAAGTVVGTLLGTVASYYFQEKGLDISGIVKGATMLWPNVYRARVTPAAFYLGFIPGLLATLMGTAVSGIGIFRRQTSQLFKELE